MTENGDAGTSLGFSFTKTKTQQRSKVAVNVVEESEKRELIVGVEGSVIKTAGGAQASTTTAKVYVIPKIENTYRTGVGSLSSRKFTPTFKPPANDAPVGGEGEDRFELAGPVAESVTQYGLFRREAPTQPAAGADASGKQQNIEQLIDQVRRADMEVLPDVASAEAYESLPIEEFGKAMLRGMGWEEGMGVGRNRRKAEATEYIQRPERLGLGAQLAAGLAAQDKRKVAKMGDKPGRQDLVLPPDADGRQRHVRKLDEKLVLRSELEPGPRPGKVMYIALGRHEGLSCTVLELLPKQEGRSERVKVCLHPSNELVEVRAKELVETRDAQLAAAAAAAFSKERKHAKAKATSSPAPSSDQERRREREQQQRSGADDELDRAGVRGGEDSGQREYSRHAGGPDGRGPSTSKAADWGQEGRRRGSGYSRGDGRSSDWAHGSKRGHAPDSDDDMDGYSVYKKKQRSSNADDEGGDTRPQHRSWLSPYIKVRIVDKSLRGGRLYLKKGTIVDVHPGATCDVVMDESKESLQLSEAALETVIPKAEGASVLIVAGPLRGQKARLLKSQSASGVAAVQLAFDLSVQRLMLDEVCQYEGPMEDD